MIEREGDSNVHAIHNGKTHRVDGRQSVQIGALEVLPRLFKIAPLAGKNLDYAGFINGFFPC